MRVGDISVPLICPQMFELRIKPACPVDRFALVAIMPEPKRIMDVWYMLCNKRAMTRVVLHSFTHLGAVSAEPAFARGFLDELAERLRGGGYEVRCTPFGHMCSWNLDVHGESLAKVYKEI